MVIVTAVILLLMSVFLPSLLESVDKVKQKRTIAEMQSVGTAMMSWLVDHTGAAAAGRQAFDLSQYTPISFGELEAALVPTYLQTLPRRDGWGFPYDYYFGGGTVRGLSVEVLGIRSAGRDGQAEGNRYTRGAFEATEYARDIVWLDGTFVRWPEHGLGRGADSDSDDDDSDASDDGDSSDDGDASDDSDQGG